VVFYPSGKNIKFLQELEKTGYPKGRNVKDRKCGNRRNEMNKHTGGYQNLILISQIGIQMMVPIFLCLFAGLWLDEKFGTWFTLPLLFLGIAAGGRNAWLLAVGAAKKDSKNRKENRREKQDETNS